MIDQNLMMMQGQQPQIEKKPEHEAQPQQIDRVKVWQEYLQGRAYHEAISLYDTVQRCEDFFVGDQWKGCKAADLDTPVFNMLQRVVTFFVSNLVSDDIGIHLERFGELEEDKPVMDMLTTQLEKVIEMTRMKSKLREFIRDSAVTGDGCMHFYFDVDSMKCVAAGSTPGNICVEKIENYRVIFGNPQTSDIDRQPYVIIEFRKMLAEVREDAKEMGVPEWESIQPDNSQHGVNDEHESGMVTVIRKYWKDRKTKTIWYADLTKECVLQDATDTGYSVYPLSWMPWTKVANLYHGFSAVKAAIPNQIFVNKAYAMAMQHLKLTAFPKIVYNRAQMPNGWSNRVGEAIPVNGDPNAAVASGFRAPDMSAQVMQLINQSISDTRDTMGASDASLGNVNPQNTSAIIATQKATSMPLELHKLDFHDSVEDMVRIMLDMMGTCYGVREVVMEVPVPTPPTIDPMTGQAIPGAPEMKKQRTMFDFSQIAGMGLTLNVDVGESSYWSEIMQVQTLDSLVAHGILTDKATYIDLVPDGYIKDKSKVEKSIEDEKQAQMQQASMMQPGGVPTPDGVSLPSSMGGLGEKMTTAIPT